jgi:hypothetical protein
MYYMRPPRFILPDEKGIGYRVASLATFGRRPMTTEALLKE